MADRDPVLSRLAVPPQEAGSAWLACRQRRPDATVRLYCFPHSGGSAGEYVRWSDGLPGVEVWGLQLPGRGPRLAEAPYRRIEALVDAMVGAVAFQPPFAFFGHSLGAVVAFETARALCDRGGPRPEALILSAYHAPHLPSTSPQVHGLPDEQLWPIVERQFGALSPELHDDPDFRQLVLAYHRADFEMIESYRWAEGPPLSVPLTVVGGTEDYPEDMLTAWRRHTTGPFALQLFTGGHFYLRNQRDTVLRFMTAVLAHGARSSAAPRRTAG
jgi:surfactin synthase thioesterase subunit